MSTPAPPPAGRPPIPYRVILASIWMVVASALLLWLLLALHRVIFLAFLATFVALVLSPAVRRLERAGVRRGLAIALVVIVAIVVVLGLAVAVAAPLARQGLRFADQAPGYLRQINRGRGPLGRLAVRFHLGEQIRRAGPAIAQSVARLPAALLSLLQQIASAAFSASLVVILSIFVLVEGPHIVNGLQNLTPDRYKEVASRLGRTTSRVVSQYMVGILLMAILNGAVAAVALSATGVPFVASLSIWAGIVDILPIIGGLLGILPAGLFGFAHSVAAGIIVVVAMTAYQQVKVHLLYPLIVGRAVKLNPLLVLLAVLVGAELGGIAGAVLAIPVAAVLQAAIGEAASALRETRAEAKPAA